MSKPKSFFEGWWVPIAATLFCLFLAAGAGVDFGPVILLVIVLGMPLPLLLFWLSWNVETLEERCARARRSSETAPPATRRSQATASPSASREHAGAV